MRIIKQRTLEAQYDVSLEGGRLNGVGNIFLSFSLVQQPPPAKSPRPECFVLSRS